MATSVIAAVVDRYNSLTNVPTLYPFDVPVKDGETVILPPYAALLDEGTTPSYEFEHTVAEVTNFIVMVYGLTLELVDGYAERIKYNGGTTTQGAGLDFGALPTLAFPYYNLSVQRVFEKSFMATPPGNEAQRIFGRELHYRVTLYRR